MASPNIILASSSPFRRQLFARLGLNFSCQAPDIDETALPKEDAKALVARLAEAKALRIAEKNPEAIVIGSDQVAHLNGQIFGKPHSKDQAIRQLQVQSGQTTLFHTGVCVIAPSQSQPLVTVNTVTTRFRDLSLAQIQSYVESEDVTATAGSLKSEGLGISLLHSIESNDPTALIGLPLIAVCDLLAQAGVELPRS